MIPVPKDFNVISLLEYNEQDKRYKDLISAEYRYINSNKEEIYKKANKMYIAVTKHKNNFQYHHFIGFRYAIGFSSFNI